MSMYQITHEGKVYFVLWETDRYFYLHRGFGDPQFPFTPIQGAKEAKRYAQLVVRKEPDK